MLDLLRPGRSCRLTLAHLKKKAECQLEEPHSGGQC